MAFAAVGMADNMPKWVKKLPAAGNATYRYVMESASAATVNEARNQAFLRVFYSTANRFGMPFSSSEVQKAVRNESDFKVVSTQYNIPINKVCEYRKKISGGVEVYLLCQVAERGNVRAIFDEFLDCEAHLSDEIAIEADYPSEWNIYQGSAYISSFQHEKNDRGISETAFKNALVEAAKREVASRMGISGDANTLVEVLSTYRQNTRDGFAVAYVEKAAACDYYTRKLDVLINTIEGGISRANNLSVANNNDRAAQELRALLPSFSDMDTKISKLTAYGCSASPASYTSRRNQLEQQVNAQINELETAVSTIFVEVTADLFGDEYMQLEQAISTRLSAKDYMLADSPDEATYKVVIKAKARQHPAQNQYSYFAYVDANVSIRNTKTNKLLYSGSVTQKGGSTFNYEDAARDAYKKIDEQVANTIAEKVKK